MKTLKQLNESATQLKVHDDSLNFVDKEDLKKYLSIAQKQMNSEAVNICNWLIEHNSEYVKMFGGKNALATFYNRGIPDDPDLKPLYKWLGALKKAGQLIQVPVFQTQDEFDSIISKEVTPDMMFLDFDSEKGRSEIVKKYTPLMHKLVNKWVNVSSFDKDDLMGFANESIVYAMNTYGKKTRSEIKKEMQTGEETDRKKSKKVSFMTYLSFCIVNGIKEAIQDLSHTVRIPRSQQKVMKQTQGYIPKSQNVSGDSPVGRDSDGDKRTLFDVVGGEENPYKNIDHHNLDELWDEVIKDLKKKFSEEDVEMMLDKYGWAGRKELSNKEMAKKYGFNTESAVSNHIGSIIRFMKTDKNMKEKLSTIYELTMECRADDDYYEREDGETVHVNINEYGSSENNLDD